MKDKIVIKDVSCDKCMYGEKLRGSELYCKRLNGPCDSRRNYCVKTHWYAQMCYLNAKLDVELEKRHTR